MQAPLQLIIAMQLLVRTRGKNKNDQGNSLDRYNISVSERVHIMEIIL